MIQSPYLYLGKVTTNAVQIGCTFVATRYLENYMKQADAKHCTICKYARRITLYTIDNNNNKC